MSMKLLIFQLAFGRWKNRQHWLERLNLSVAGEGAIELAMPSMLLVIYGHN